jgi:hypothetical protein
VSGFSFPKPTLGREVREAAAKTSISTKGFGRQRGVSANRVVHSPQRRRFDAGDLAARFGAVRVDVGGELCEALVTGSCVVVEGEAELVAVERDGPVNGVDRDHHHFERPIHQSLFRSSSSFS